MCQILLGRSIAVLYHSDYCQVPTSAAGVFKTFCHLVEAGEVWNENDVVVFRFAGNDVEFGQTDSMSNANSNHLRLDNAFQPVSLPLRLNVIL